MSVEIDSAIEKELQDDIVMDERVEGIVRTIHSHVVVFYNEYSTLSEYMREGDENKISIEKLRKILSNLEDINKLCSNELKTLSSQKENSSLNKYKGDYDAIKTSLLKVVGDLQDYASYLELMINCLNDKGLTEAFVKRSIREKFDMLSSTYELFKKADNELVSELLTIVKNVAIPK